jgi:hypothetical protein
MHSSTNSDFGKGFSISWGRFGLPEVRAFHSLFLVNQNTTEGEKVAVKLQCLWDCCKYPKTCTWNKRCMEEGMRLSKEAKMAREKAIRRETDDDAGK